MNNLILYTAEDGHSQTRLRAQEHTVWLTQLEMAKLFDASKQNVSLHLKNLFAAGSHKTPYRVHGTEHITEERKPHHG